MMFKKYIDNFWKGIFLTITVFVIVILSGYLFGIFGEPFFVINFNLEGLTSPVSWIQIAFVALVVGMAATWLRRNSAVMRKM